MEKTFPVREKINNFGKKVDNLLNRTQVNTLLAAQQKTNEISFTNLNSENRMEHQVNEYDEQDEDGYIILDETCIAVCAKNLPSISTSNHEPSNRGKTDSRKTRNSSSSQNSSSFRTPTYDQTPTGIWIQPRFRQNFSATKNESQVKATEKDLITTSNENKIKALHSDCETEMKNMDETEIDTKSKSNDNAKMERNNEAGVNSHNRTMKNFEGTETKIHNEIEKLDKHRPEVKKDDQKEIEDNNQLENETKIPNQAIKSNGTHTEMEYNDSEIKKSKQNLEEAGEVQFEISHKTETKYDVAFPSSPDMSDDTRLPPESILNKDDNQMRTSNDACQCKYHALLSISHLPSSFSTTTTSTNPKSMFELTCETFDGKIPHVYSKCFCQCKECPCRGEVNEHYQIRKKRSDASLLLGLALWNHDHNHIKVKSIKILLYPKLDDQPKSHNFASHSSTGTSTKDNEFENFEIKIYTASIAITFSVIPGLQYRERGLPSSTQLLLSIIRSDWKIYDAKMEFLVNNASHVSSSKKKTDSFFPSELTLEELYDGMQPSSKKFASLHETSFSLQDNTPSTSEACIVSLPEIIITFIGSYLRARSLNSFRLCCKYLYNALGTTVPGLKLSLYQHQITSLDWMRNRERCIMSELDALSLSNKFSDNFSPGGDCHRCISAGSTVLLRKHKAMAQHVSNDVGADISRLDTITGKVFQSNWNYEYRGDHKDSIEKKLATKVARGGLLCDDPGLGKTITVLSLILQTYGLSTHRHVSFQDLNEEISKIDESIFALYWKQLGYSQTNILSKIMNELRKQDSFSILDRRIYPIHNKRELEISGARSQLTFRHIKKNVSDSSYSDDFEQFTTDMSVCFENHISNCAPDSLEHSEANSLLNNFQSLVQEVKKNQVVNAINLKQNNVDPVSIQVRKRVEAFVYDALVPSSSTLLIVPSTLITHWEEQIRLHIDFSFCSNKIPIIYCHVDDYIESRKNDELLQNIGKGTHMPFVFIDKASSLGLPSAKTLALFPIVITSNQRISNEWRNGSLNEKFQLKTKKSRTPVRYSEHYDGGEENRKSNCTPTPTCPILEVHWLRLIVDEGHSMGRGGHVNAIEFASWIHAERRWVMTGTPTPQRSGNNGLKNIWHLMSFLRHDLLTSKFDGEQVWRKCLNRPWGDGELVSFFRLKSLLSFLMVRHTKANHIELQKPSHEYTHLTLSPCETMGYNELVSAVRANINITSLESKTSGWQDSLLHPKQAKHAKEALTNIRIVCCGGARIETSLSGKNYTETLTLLKNLHNADEVSLSVVKNFLNRACMSFPTSCMVCGIQLQTLLLLPCIHFVCTHCMDIKIARCPVCEKSFDIDDFQRLQPGFESKITWINAKEDEEEKIKRERRMRTEIEEVTRNGQAMPLIMDNEPFHPAEDVEQAEPMVLNLSNIYQQRRRRRRNNDHICRYPCKFIDGRCTVCSQEHECSLLTKSECNICKRVPEDCPTTETKACYLIKKLLQVHKHMNDRISSHYFSDKTASMVDSGAPKFQSDRPIKVVVFSQFRLILNVVGHRLLRRFGTKCVAEYWGKYRNRELEKFKSPECFCLLLSKDGSHGLDLSFVTHIWFLEQVWDKSLENQVIARAYRMGAKGSVKVEQLLAKNSVEELMLSMNQKFPHQDEIVEQTVKEDEKQEDSMRESGSEKSPAKRRKVTSASKCSRNMKGDNAIQHAKRHFLLSNLKLIGFPPPGRDLKRSHRSENETNPDEPSNEKELAKKRSKKIRFASDVQVNDVKHESQNV